MKTIYVDDEVHQKLKRESVEWKKTMSEHANMLLRVALKLSMKPPKKGGK